MADFDFLDGFDAGGDWGFTGVSSKPSDQTVASAKATEQVVKQTRRVLVRQFLVKLFQD